jgi:23S rRNA (uracil1939-C5)-methyltransferase
MRKGDVIENLLVETMAAEGKCVSRLDGKVVFLEGGAPGDTVDAQVTKIKSSFLEARVTRIRTFSPDRAEPFCIHFGLCGGCSWQHIQYETQLAYKQKQVVDNLERLGGLDLPYISPIIPSEKTALTFLIFLQLFLLKRPAFIAISWITLFPLSDG